MAYTRYIHTSPLVWLCRAISAEVNGLVTLKVVLSSPESRGILECCPDMQAWLAPRKDEEMACGAGYRPSWQHHQGVVCRGWSSSVHDISTDESE